MPEVFNVSSSERRPLLLLLVLMLRLLAMPPHVSCLQISSLALKIMLGGHFPAWQGAGHHWLVFRTGFHVHGKGSIQPSIRPPRSPAPAKNKTIDFVSHHMELTSHQWGAGTLISLGPGWHLQTDFPIMHLPKCGMGGFQSTQPPESVATRAVSREEAPYQNCRIYFVHLLSFQPLDYQLP